MHRIFVTALAAAAVLSFTSHAASQERDARSAAGAQRPQPAAQGNADAGATAPEDPATRTRIRAEGAVGGVGAKPFDPRGVNAGAGPHRHRQTRPAPREPAQSEPEWPAQTESK